MSGWLPPRLRSLLGPDLGAVGFDRLQNLLGLVEDTDLEFKSEPYGMSDGQRKELAYDLAGMANAIGGLLLVGVAEDGKGRATDMPGFAHGHDLAHWIDQVVAERIRPRPNLSQRSISVGEREVHLVSVEPSTLAPFAVSVGDGGLRYPLRIGRARTWLHEPDIADRYRRRFATTREVDKQLLQIHTEALQRIPTRELSDPWAWLVVSLVPDLPGYLELRRGIAESWDEWLQPALRSFPSLVRDKVRVELGFRTLSFTDLAEPGKPRLYAWGGQLNVDGSGVMILGCRGQTDRVHPRLCAVFDEHVVGDLVNAVGALSRHALRTGAAGAGQISAEILCTQRPMVLAEYRSAMPGALNESRTVSGSTGVSKHSVSLDAAAVPGIDLVAIVRAIAVDLVSAFGLAEPQQITALNQLVRKRFQAASQVKVEAWSNAAGVELIDNF